MTASDIKERLRAYPRACKKCYELEHRIAHRRASLQAPRAVRTDSLPGGNGNTLEAAIEKIDELERLLHSEQDRRDAALADVRSLIAIADDVDCRMILSLRYIDGARFEDIPERLFISERSMWRKYNRAIDDIVTNSEKNGDIS